MHHASIIAALVLFSAFAFARAATAGIARVFHRSSFRFDLGDAGAAFHFHDLIAQERRAFEFKICRSLLHFLLKLAQQLGYVEIAASFAD